MEFVCSMLLSEAERRASEGELKLHLSSPEGSANDEKCELFN